MNDEIDRLRSFLYTPSKAANSPQTGKEGAKFSLKAILGNQFHKFMEQFVYEPIEKWALEGKIDSVTLRRLNRVLKKHGIDALDVPAQQIAQATRHSMQGGELLRVNLPITGDLSIENFVKIFSSPEKYRDAVEKERRLYEAVKGTTAERLVVQPLFQNDERNLVSYPFINAKSLHDVLDEDPDNSHKPGMILSVIKDYQALAKAHTERRSVIESGGYTLGSLMDSDESFDKFFFKRLGHENGETDELRDLVSKYFAPLNGCNDHVIHGDLILDNVIMDGEHARIIDPEDACMGFLEFDYCKLLTKAGLSDEQEEDIVEFAAMGMYNDQEDHKLTEAEVKELFKPKPAHSRMTGMHGWPDGGGAPIKYDREKIEASLKRYTLNRIAQELFTSVRYLKRAKENESESMANMALVSYNIALRKIGRAIERGYVGEDLKKGIEEFVGTHHADELYCLGDPHFERLKKKFNPHSRKSQDNVVSAPSLDLLITGEDDKKDVQLELKHLKRNLRRRKGFWKKVGLYASAAVASIAAFAGFLNVTDGYEARLSKTKQEKEALAQEERYKNLLLVVNGKGSVAIDVKLLEHKVRYLKEVLGDERMAYAWILHPDATYEAMQETGSKDFNKVFGYMVKHRIGNCYVIEDVIKKSTYLDNIIRIYSPHNKDMCKKEYEKQLKQVQEKYEQMKAKKDMQEKLKDAPNPNLNL